MTPLNLPNRLFLPWKQAVARNTLVGFLDEVLRGIGQVMFQNSPITGLFFLAGLFVGGWQFGVFGLLGTVSSTLAARWLGVPASAVQAGVYGYNGTLVGVALAFYLADNALLPAYVIFAAAVSAVVSGAIGNLLSTWKVPALTGPFVVTTWFFALGTYGFDRLAAGANAGGPALPTVTAGERAALDLPETGQAVLRGVAEVFFQGSVVVGILFLLGLLVSSRIDCLMAIAGSVVGLVTGWLLGVDAGSLTLGVMGYNAVLTMIALAGLFYVLDVNSVALAVIASATSVVVTVALGAIVAPYGGHVYTAPFVVTTWLFIAAKPYLHRVRAVPPVDATTPEGNLNLYRLSGHWWEQTSDS